MLKAKMHGMSSIANNEVKVQSEKLNLVGLIATFEANLDKQPQKDWMVQHEEITALYNILFSEGDLPPEVLNNTSYEVLQYAYENMDGEDLQDLMREASSSSGTNYFYEYGRSLGVEVQASRLKEYIDEEHDFI